jgi:hypothetical protein
MSFLILSRPVVIDNTNRAIRMTEGATTSTVNIATGTYWIKGDGTSTDLLKAITDAMDTVSTNTYGGTLVLDPSLTLPARVRFTRLTGSNTFGVLWANAATTFAEALIGFPNTNDTVNALDKTATLAPTGLWYGGEAVASDEPEPRASGYVERSAGGVINAGLTSSILANRNLNLAFVPIARAQKASAILAGHEALAYESFWERSNNGAALSLGLSVDGVTAPVWSPDTWVLAKESAERIPWTRLSPGSPLYSWPLGLHKWVAP